MSLLNNWAPIEVEQALPLLSNKFCVNEIYSRIGLTQQIIKRFNEIRKVAVKCLDRQDEHKLDLIML